MSDKATIDARRPLDTSTLGPIRVEPCAIAERARVVREALQCVAATEGLPFEDRGWACRMADCGDATLAKLGRLLKC